MARTKPLNGTGSSAAGGILDLIQTILKFIVDNFRRMPKFIQIFVYLIFVGIFVFLIWRYTYSPPPPKYIQIKGEIKFADGNGIPDSLMYYDLVSKGGIYVMKEPQFDQSNYFYYRWICFIRTDEANKEIPLAFAKYDATTRQFITSRPLILYPVHYLPFPEDSVLHSITDASFSYISEPPYYDKSITQQTSGNRWMPFSTAFAQTNTIPKTINKNATIPLVNEYFSTKSPMTKLTLLSKFELCDDESMLMIVDSMKYYVQRNNPEIGSTFAAILTGFKNLSELCSDGKYSGKLSSEFYQKTVPYMNSANETISRNMSGFFQKIQDARMLNYVFFSYSLSTTLLAKRLYLDVLASFSSNRSAAIRTTVIDWLENTKNVETDNDLKNEISRLLQKRFKGNDNLRQSQR